MSGVDTTKLRKQTYAIVDADWAMSNYKSDIIAALEELDAARLELDSLRASNERLKAAAALVDKYVGCGDNSCAFVTRTGGMGTNGGCACFERRNPFLQSGLANLYRAAKAVAK